MPSTLPLRVVGALFCLLLASGCDVASIGDDSVTVRVIVQDVNTKDPLPNARVGVGYTRFLYDVDWIETTETNASGQVVFTIAECERDELIVNAFGASAAGGGSYGPSKEYLPCKRGEHSVTLELAQY